MCLLNNKPVAQFKKPSWGLWRLSLIFYCILDVGFCFCLLLSTRRCFIHSKQIVWDVPTGYGYCRFTQATFDFACTLRSVAVSRRTEDRLNCNCSGATEWQMISRLIYIVLRGIPITMEMSLLLFRGFLSERVQCGFDVFIRSIGNSKLWYRVGTVVGMEPFIDWYRSLSAVHFE